MHRKIELLPERISCGFHLIFGFLLLSAAKYAYIKSGHAVHVGLNVADSSLVSGHTVLACVRKLRVVYQQHWRLE